MALINVRLDASDVKKAAALREAGVAISALVREAIRAEYNRLVAPKRKIAPSATAVKIIQSLPAPAELPAREFETADRRSVQRHISSKLRRTRR